MSCSDVCVSMDADDYGSCDFYRESIRRAAKPHVCSECRKEIAIGERYEYVAGKTDGDFCDVRSCLVCAEIRKAFVCGGWVIGELWESIRDQLFPTWDEMKAIDCLAKLTSDEAIAKMRAEYAEYMEDRQ